MEEIKEQFKKLMQLCTEEKEFKILQRALKEKIETITNQNHQTKLELSPVLSDIKYREFEQSKEEFAAMKNEEREEKKQLQERFKVEKAEVIALLEKEVAKYRRASKIEALGDKAEGAIAVESNMEEYSELYYFLTRMRGLELERLDELVDDDYYQQHFAEKENEQQDEAEKQENKDKFKNMTAEEQWLATKMARKEGEKQTAEDRRAFVNQYASGSVNHEEAIERAKGKAQKPGEEIDSEISH